MNKYRALGLKLTPQRLAILQYLDGNRAHPSAENIYQNVKKKYPTMSYATVYNTIEALKRKGDLLELTIDPERRRYDPETRPHHHLVCMECKKIVDIFKDFSLSFPREAKGSFEAVGYHIKFYGTCPECKLS
jgi:Fur family peroxide stress response transcriptional regulator